jgi:hypothetical protein
MQKNILDNFPMLNVLKSYFRDGIKMCIAGGCFKSFFNFEKAKDIDIFFETKKDFEVYLSEIREDDDYEMIYENSKAIGFKHFDHHTRIDLVRSVFAKPEQIISNFDFTVSKFALFEEEVIINIKSSEVKTKQMSVIYADNYFEHLHLKKLVIDDKIPFPISSFNRMIRYIRYGFIPCNKTKAKLIESIQKISSKEIDIPKELYESFD